MMIGTPWRSPSWLRTRPEEWLRPCRVCMAGVLPSDQRKVRYPAVNRLGTSLAAAERNFKRRADFFFVNSMNDQCSRYQHR